MLYKYLFNYTKKDYINLIKEELKIMLLGSTISLSLCLISAFGFDKTSSKLVFGGLFFGVFLYFFRFITKYGIEYFTLNLEFLECHYAKVTTRFDSKKDMRYVEVTYLDNKLEYNEKRFRLSTTKESQNNIIFNGPNIILFYTKLTNILVGFIYTGKAVKFYNVDNGESLEVYQELVQKE